VESADAGFIHQLRTGSQSKHLSRVSPDVKDQIDWLARYAISSNEAYFVIETAGGHSIGTVRLYDAREDSFCWGSWILTDDAPASAGIESALLVYAYALQFLGFKRSHFQVRKGNERVRAFHQRFGAVLTGEDATEYRYSISNEAIVASMHRYARYLPAQVLVEF
jgi:RimJ/RimL family protein N-acetyltransferase